MREQSGAERVTPITSVTVGSRWIGDKHTTEGRVVRVVAVHDGEVFDPYVSIEVEADPDPDEVGQGRYSRASWLQTWYRPA